jgi:GNAT superfamily N-acetyltransferase
MAIRPALSRRSDPALVRQGKRGNTARRRRRLPALGRGRARQDLGFCERDLQGALSRLYVHKDHLRMGIGSRLLAVAEASLKALGFTEVTLEATVTAMGFYAANGYRLMRRAAYQGGSSEPVYRMRKRL